MFSLKANALILTIFATLLLLDGSEGSQLISPFGKRFDSITGIDYIQLCLNSCTQCRRMFGDYFQEHACSESCFKFKGKAIPDCEDMSTIAHYLNAVETR